MDWWLPPKSVAFSKKLRRALKTWVATGCQLPLCPMQLNNELFLKGRYKQYISITVHRTLPLVLNNYWKWVLPFLPSHFQCFTNTWKSYSSVPKWYSYGRHEVTNTWRMAPKCWVEEWGQNVQDGDGQVIAQSWVIKRITEYWSYLEMKRTWQVGNQAVRRGPGSPKISVSNSLRKMVAFASVRAVRSQYSENQGEGRPGILTFPTFERDFHLFS